MLVIDEVGNPATLCGPVCNPVWPSLQPSLCARACIMRYTHPLTTAVPVTTARYAGRCAP